jgi:hypothetical protein
MFKVRFNPRRELVERVQGLRLQLGAEEPKRTEEKNNETNA